jgi:predicted ABC-type ATPase
MESMAFETVFSTSSKPIFLARAVRAGYFVRLFFVGTKDPAINVRCVAKRVSLGGHDVPETKIRSRYHLSINNLVNGLSWADRGYVFDNSVDGRDARLVMRAEQGKLAKIYPGGEVPRWCHEVLATLEVSPWPGEDDFDKGSGKP